MDTPDITILSIVWLLLLLLPIAYLVRWLGMSFNKRLFVSVARMIIQMALVGLYLQYLFDLNNPFVNVAYMLLMIIIATYTSVRSSKLRIRSMAIPLFWAITIPQFAVLLFFNWAVVRLDYILDARFLVTIGGMILGNCMRSNIITLNSFYDTLRQQVKKYEYSLVLGASRLQAFRPFVQQAITQSTEPILATMATLGLVSLPGMMTGQILGGTVPLVAIKYQIAIMLAIFIAIFLSSILAIYFSQKKMFDGFGTLRKEAFG